MTNDKSTSLKQKIREADKKIFVIEDMLHMTGLFPSCTAKILTQSLYFVTILNCCKITLQIAGWFYEWIKVKIFISLMKIHFSL